MLKTFVFGDQAEAAREAGGMLEKELARYADVPTLLLLSGGSALGLLEHVSVFPHALTVGMLDERYSGDPAVNNFSLFTKTSFFEKAKNHGALFLDSRVDPEKESLEEYTGKFESGLSGWREAHPGGAILITQGIGADGHTAGIFPYPEAPRVFEDLFGGAEWVLGYEARGKNKYPFRVTVTPAFLKEEVRFSLVYAWGDEKKEALARLLDELGTVVETPARVVREMKSVILVTH